MTDNPKTPSARVIESAWRDQAVWSETANRMKRDLTAWRTRAAVAGVLGAFLETLAASLDGLGGPGWWWLQAAIALAGAVILAVVPYVLKTRVSHEQVRNWVRARSVSEALKETIYRFMVHVPPFGADSSPAELIRRCQELKDKVPDLDEYAAMTDPPKKERPLSLTLDEYIEKRLTDQIDQYYRPKARENALRAARLHNLEFLLGMLAVALGAAAGAASLTKIGGLPLISPWVAVVTTAGAAVTAHLAASRYDHQAMTYFGTAGRLTSLRDAWFADPRPADAAGVARFVDACEHAISTENEAWLADWTQVKRQPDSR